jgi:hypothetical protein
LSGGGTVNIWSFVFFFFVSLVTNSCRNEHRLRCMCLSVWKKKNLENSGMDFIKNYYWEVLLNFATSDFCHILRGSRDANHVYLVKYLLRRQMFRTNIIKKKAYFVLKV